MRTTHTVFFLALCALGLATVPASAQADDDRACKHSAPQSLTLDIGDARVIQFHVGPSKLRLDGRPGTTGSLQGRACGSSQNELARLRLEQSREGDRLVVRLAREERIGWSFGNRYAYFDLSGTVPDGMPIEVRVGSGDAWATGLSGLDLTVGSGDADARRIAGKVEARVGSGDIVLADIGSLDVGSIGSGDLEARGVRGDARVGSVGSGDLGLRDVGGSVDIGSIGSGDADLERIAGSVEVGSVGSGDIDASGVGGDLRVRALGSGSVDHDGVAGKVDLPRKR
ncbi:hypothetical protein [Luteimonas terricola]|uniref:Adhesin domain-containing protein n=1 Tax=Luteimonas terricola TaxID=645597 RepID=A0ABQ2EBC5_9GAMM|nr:hypothetical protein [Luteimonas terricola]GGK04934.1 hypothetical protein GCM10011394_12550 [Luteimonas terricola]